MKTEYIHYGSSELLPIKPIRNERFFWKPQGGLWASPVDSPLSWNIWCERNYFRKNELGNSFTFTLKNDAKIIHIYSVDDLKGLPRQTVDISFFNDHACFLDFEKIEKEYDGIELHLSEERFGDSKNGDVFHYGLYFMLYGWDCDSIILFHNKAIEKWWKSR